MLYCHANNTQHGTPGVCGCGRPATTEVQVGWHNGDHGQPSGGQYDEVCEECYADSDEAQRHQAEARRLAAHPSGVCPVSAYDRCPACR